MNPPIAIICVVAGLASGALTMHVAWDWRVSLALLVMLFAGLLIESFAEDE
jgi:hypothetical protein